MEKIKAFKAHHTLPRVITISLNCIRNPALLAGVSFGSRVLAIVRAVPTGGPRYYRGASENIGEPPPQPVST